MSSTLNGGEARRPAAPGFASTTQSSPGTPLPGRRAFTGNTTPLVYDAILHGDPPPMGGNHSALDPIVRKALVRALTGYGFKVLNASNGQQAEQVFDRAPHVDILLTDVVMPNMGGRELATRLCRKNDQLRVVFMTGYFDEDRESGTVSRGGVTWIQKPFSIAAVINKLLDLPPVSA